MTLSIIIPCYNEEKNIPLILARFSEFIIPNMEVIIVNNGSNDNSAAVLLEMAKKYFFFKVVNVPVNKGYGYGIVQGLRCASGDYIGWTHADMQTDVYDTLRAYRILASSSEKIFVKGRRRNRPFIDTLFTFGMSVFESILLKTMLFDINAQPNFFPKEFFDEWENTPFDFSLDLYALYMAKLKKLKIIRFNVLFNKRIHGQSHWNTGLKSKWKFIKRTINYSFKLKKEVV